MRLLQLLALRWLRWRHGDVLTIRPPLHRSPFLRRRSAGQRLAGSMRYAVWAIEYWLFRRYGQPMRERWISMIEEGTP